MTHTEEEVSPATRFQRYELRKTAVDGPRGLSEELSTHPEAKNRGLALVLLDLDDDSWITNTVYVNRVWWFTGGIELPQQWITDEISGANEDNRRAAALVYFNIEAESNEAYMQVPEIMESKNKEETFWLDIIKVMGDRWWSAQCNGVDCCPPEGKPIKNVDYSNSPTKSPYEQLTELLQGVQTNDGEETRKEEDPQTD